jgi:hypothetical protein
VREGGGAAPPAAAAGGGGGSEGGEVARMESSRVAPGCAAVTLMVMSRGTNSPPSSNSGFRSCVGQQKEGVKGERGS